jgi:hypothetical protein
MNTNECYKNSRTTYPFVAPGNHAFAAANKGHDNARGSGTFAKGKDWGGTTRRVTVKWLHIDREIIIMIIINLVCEVADRS